MYHSEVKENIERWISEHFSFAKVTDETSDKTNFVLNVEGKDKKSKIPPMRIFQSKDSDIVQIGWTWHFDDRTKKSYAALLPEAKEKLQKGIQMGFLLMHLDLNVRENFQNLEGINSYREILEDGITKDRVIDVFREVLSARAFVMSQFDALGVPGTKFDPYSLG